jgi:hypothetical protein
MDLLIFYLDTGFNFPPYKDTKTPMNLTHMSKSLDPYLMAIARPDLDAVVERPKMRLSRGWRDLLARVAERQLRHWPQVQMILLDVGYENQQLLESGFKKTKKNVRRNWKRPNHDCAYSVTTNQGERSVAVIAFAYKNLSKSERNEKASNVLQEVIERTKCKQLLLFGMDVDGEERDYPYSFAGLHIEGVEL